MEAKPQLAIAFCIRHALQLPEESPLLLLVFLNLDRAPTDARSRNGKRVAIDAEEDGILS